MIELVTVIAVGSIAATFFSDVISRVVKGAWHMLRRGANDAHAQPAQ
ncbi:MAG: hypothetical protein HY054_05260 [Proteobacteria bacterium]|nr:hypothetical protein [Pseudomonadota bacterium]